MPNRIASGSADAYVNKRQVRLLAKTLGAPELLITKAPTADLEDLAPGKTDEDALGLGYDQLDDFLEGQPQEPGLPGPQLAPLLSTTLAHPESLPAV
jgi:NAD+ synthase